jgi:ribosomal-protein-serine acetyltransferase
MATADQTQFTFCPPTTAEAGWLVCRRVRRDDATDLYDAVRASIDHLKPWMPWATDSYSRQEADDFTIHQTLVAEGEPVAEAPYVVRDRDGRFLGMCGLHARLGPGALEIGYWVDVRHARRGVTTLAAALLTETALTLPGIDSVEIRHDQANVASRAIPAKLGYTHVETQHDQPEAPGELGLCWRWLLRREDFPTAPAAHFLATARTPPLN